LGFSGASPPRSSQSSGSSMRGRVGAAWGGNLEPQVKVQSTSSVQVWSKFFYHMFNPKFQAEVSPSSTTSSVHKFGPSSVQVLPQVQPQVQPQVLPQVLPQILPQVLSQVSGRGRSKFYHKFSPQVWLKFYFKFNPKFRPKSVQVLPQVQLQSIVVNQTRLIVMGAQLVNLRPSPFCVTDAIIA
jgi:hypothetical protein